MKKLIFSLILLVGLCVSVSLIDQNPVVTDTEQTAAAAEAVHTGLV